MYYLPRGFKRYFIEIKRLEIKEYHLKELSRDDLAQFPELWDLSVPYNDITTIESDLLDMNPKIQHLNLRHNRITFIAEKIEKMTNLELILDDNFINQTVYKQKHEINETKHETTEVSDYSTIILSVVLAISIIMNAFLIIILWLSSKQQNIEPRKMTKKNSLISLDDPIYEDIPANFQNKLSNDESNITHYEIYEMTNLGSKNEEDVEENHYEVVGRAEENEKEEKIPVYATVDMAKKHRKDKLIEN